MFFYKRFSMLNTNTISSPRFLSSSIKAVEFSKSALQQKSSPNRLIFLALVGSLAWVSIFSSTPTFAQIPGITGGAAGAAAALGGMSGLGGLGGLAGGAGGLGGINIQGPAPITANDATPGNTNNSGQQGYQLIPLKPNEFQKFILETSGNKLPLFGLDFFENLHTNSPTKLTDNATTATTSGVFAPLDNSPVNNDYTLGPGDQVIIRGWGSLTVDAKLVVDRNGQISVPKVGSITVSGVKASKLDSVVKNAFAKYYKDFELSVTLGQLRSITVYVVGQARRPGSYALSSLSTLASGLFATGGPNSNGSMRRVQLKRGGQVITEFDLYQFLSEGLSTSDVKLIDGDIIYIPPAAGYVAIVGKVNTPAVYELKNKDETLDQILSIAGGLPVVADPRRVTLERLDNSKRQSREVEDFALDARGLKTVLRNGDLLTILSITPELSNAVTLRGSVAQPVRVGWRDGMRIKDLIPNREALISRDSIRRQNETLFDANQRERTLREREMIPSDLLDDSDLTARVNKINSSPASKMPNPNTPPQVPTGVTGNNNVQNLLMQSSANNECQDNPALLKCKEVRDVESLKNFREGRLFKDQPINQDNYAQSNAPLSERIGNLYDEINWDYAVIERLNRTDLNVTLIPFSLSNVLKNEKDPDNQLLQPGDVVTVFSVNDIRVPISKRRIMVRVEGEVAKPGVYQAKAGESLTSIVQRAGGLTHDAYLYGSGFYRDEVKKSQQENLQKLLKRLEAESNTALLQASQSMGATSNLGATQARIQAAQNAQRQAIERLRTLKPEGRIALGLTPELYNRVDRLPDIHLQNGDRFVVPTRPDFVYIFGSVNTESALLYKPEKTVADYLKLSGVGAGADRNSAILIRADGSALTNSGSWSNTVLSAKAMPGDSIVLPEKLDQESSWSSIVRNTVDITQIFYQLGLGVAAIKILR